MLGKYDLLYGTFIIKESNSAKVSLPKDLFVIKLEKFLQVGICVNGIVNQIVIGGRIQTT